MKKTAWIILSAAVLLCILTGCTRYSSSYRAVGLVHSNISHNAYMSFSDFEGTKVFKLKCDGASADQIRYSAKLAAGSATAYYDCNGTKTELFSVSAGDDFSDVGGTLRKGTVYIIVETDGKCTDGSFSFSTE